MTIVKFEYLGYEVEAVLISSDNSYYCKVCGNYGCLSGCHSDYYEQNYCESYTARCLTTGEVFEYLPKLDSMIAKRAIEEV